MNAGERAVLSERCRQALADIITCFVIETNEIIADLMREAGGDEAVAS